MMSPQEIFIQWLYRNQESGTSFIDLIIKAVLETSRLDPIAAQDFATANVRRYWNAAKKRSAQDVLLGRSPCIHCLNDTLLQYHDPEKYLNSQGLTEIALRIKARPHLLANLDTCNSREYEAAAHVTMLLIGASEAHLTPPGNEGGVDFFALLNCDTHTHLFGNSHRAIRIVGQSKKYGDRETVTHFNSFIKVLENVRHRHSSVVKHIPNWFGRGDGPIVGLFVAHTGLQSGASDMAREHGIVIADSIDLSEMAALSDKLNPSANPLDRAKMHNKLIKDTVTKYT